MRQAVLALAVVVAAGALAVTFAEEDKDQAKKDLKLLEGTWDYTKHVANGKETAKENLEGLTLTVKGDKWEVKKDDKVFLGGTVKLDPSKKPKAADWTITTEGQLKDKTAKAIYKLDKDTFEHCYGEGDDRPEKFESKQDSKITHTKFARVKKKE